MTIRGTARKYKIPESTLRGKLSGRYPPMVGHSTTGRLLTNAEEQVLANWIEQSQRRAMPVTKQIVLGALEDILLKEQELQYERNLKNPKSTHERWWKIFKVHQPKIVFEYSKEKPQCKLH